MTIRDYIDNYSKQLEAADIPTARLDCLVLLEDILHTDRTQLLAHDDQVLTNEQLSKLNSAIERRKKHEPLAYIRGKSEFYGRVFNVTPDTLEPRPETETMVSLFLDWLRDNKEADKMPLKIIDIGSGSGAIAITVKLEKPDLIVIGTELNQKTLKIAQKNAKTLQADVTFQHSNLLEPTSEESAKAKAGETPTVLLCNLPYVPDSYTINEAAMQEPEMAIFGGTDGLDLYRELFNQIDKLKIKPIAIFTESLPFQHHGLATIARQHGYIQDTKDDFIQLFQPTAN